MSSNFNLFYHGSASDISDALEHGANLDQYEAKALLCNIVRRIARIEEKLETPAPVRKRYKVAAVKLVAFGRVHELDEGVEGCYFYNAIDEEDALDQFHSSVPIKVLEDFEIDVEEDQ
ncbi:MAG: hypothetical protein KAU31_08015 [Spirochaetaceae bacterium]|nr:hypothetical protein [Spirochaetaceae bacterium]